MLIMTENRPTVVPTIQIDNAKSRVTEWRFAPNAETGWHRHAYDYVVIPMVTGQLLLDRKSTRLNSSHKPISYAVFCLKKNTHHITRTQAYIPATDEQYGRPSL